MEWPYLSSLYFFQRDFEEGNMHITRGTTQPSCQHVADLISQAVEDDTKCDTNNNDSDSEVESSSSSSFESITTEVVSDISYDGYSLEGNTSSLTHTDNEKESVAAETMETRNRNQINVDMGTADQCQNDPILRGDTDIPEDTVNDNASVGQTSNHTGNSIPPDTINDNVSVNQTSNNSGNGNLDKTNQNSVTVLIKDAELQSDITEIGHESNMTVSDSETDENPKINVLNTNNRSNGILKLDITLPSEIYYEHSFSLSDCEDMNTMCDIDQTQSDTESMQGVVMTNTEDIHVCVNNKSVTCSEDRERLQDLNRSLDVISQYSMISQDDV